MTDTEILQQVILGAFGALLLMVMSLLVRVLWQLNDKQQQQQDTLTGHSYTIKEISGEKIPTIRIQIEKLEDRTDKIEDRTDRLEQAIGKGRD